MASENETVADIVAMLRRFAKGEELPTDDIPSFTSLANRIESAHRSEVEELRECLKEAVDLRCGRLKCEKGVCFYSESGKENECTAHKWRKALEGAKDEGK